MSDPASPIQGIQIGDPLESVDLTVPRPDAGRPEQSVAAIDGFKAAANAAQSRVPVVDPVTASSEADSPEEVATRVTQENHETLAQMSEILSGAQRLQAEREIQDLESLRRTIERNKQIHDALPPIRVSDLLLSDYITQEVSISEDYSLTFRTVSTEVGFDAAETAATVLAEWPKEAKAPGNIVFMQQLANLVCGLTHLCKAPRHAQAIHQVDDRGERQKMIAVRMKELLRLPPEALQDMFAHQALINARVRNAFGHAGWVAKNVGNS